MRLFLALDLPPSLRAGLAHLQREWKPSLHGWRWLRPEAIHLTIRFLGEVDDGSIPRAAAGWRAAAAQVSGFRFRTSEPGCFPPRGRARVLWIGVEADPPEALDRLARAVEEATVASGFAPETRPFRPHLTLARALRDGRPTRPGPCEGGTSAPAGAACLTLFGSTLTPEGARYTALETFPFRDA